MSAFLDERLLPIPLRSDVTVWIGPLPRDLTLDEAAKVGRVVLAFAQSNQTPAPSSPHKRGSR